MSYVVPKEVDEVREKFVTWLNDNLDDPYEQATNKKRSGLVYGDDDFKLVGAWPKVHFSFSSLNPSKIVGNDSKFTEEEEITFHVYYYNHKSHRYTFGNGNTLSGEHQCFRFLRHIQAKISDNKQVFGEYCHGITMGTVSKPVFNTKSSLFAGFFPLVVKVYRSYT